MFSAIEKISLVLSALAWIGLGFILVAQLTQEKDKCKFCGDDLVWHGWKKRICVGCGLEN